MAVRRRTHPLRALALLGAGAVAIHQLRYAIAYGNTAPQELAAHHAYFDLALPLLRPGALVLVDNVLWKGRVATGEHDEETDAIRDFNAYTMSHPRLTAVILPLGDGVLYAVVE